MVKVSEPKYKLSILVMLSSADVDINLIYQQKNFILLLRCCL